MHGKLKKKEEKKVEMWADEIRLFSDIVPTGATKDEVDDTHCDYFT